MSIKCLVESSSIGGGRLGGWRGGHLSRRRDPRRRREYDVPSRRCTSSGSVHGKQSVGRGARAQEQPFVGTKGGTRRTRTVRQESIVSISWRGERSRERSLLGSDILLAETNKHGEANVIFQRLWRGTSPVGEGYLCTTG